MIVTWPLRLPSCQRANIHLANLWAGCFYSNVSILPTLLSHPPSAIPYKTCVLWFAEWSPQTLFPPLQWQASQGAEPPCSYRQRAQLQSFLMFYYTPKWRSHLNSLSCTDKSDCAWFPCCFDLLSAEKQSTGWPRVTSPGITACYSKRMFL